METVTGLSKHGPACPPEETLEQYAMIVTAFPTRQGKLPEQECDRIEEHLLWCPACRDQLSDAMRWTALVKAAALEEDAPAAPVGPAWRRWIEPAVAALRSAFAMPTPALAGGLAAVAMAVIWVGNAGIPESGGGSRRAEPQAISLTAMRGDDLHVSAKAGTPIVLQFGVADADAVSGAVAAIVDGSGNDVWKGALAEGSSSVRVPALAKGDYWVRLFRSPGGEQIKEYGLRVQ